ncbi:erythromycin esterase family protein [Flavitalea flava]
MNKFLNLNNLLFLIGHPIGRVSFMFVLIFYSATLFGQQKMEEYVRKNIFPVKTIAPDSSDYADLENIGTAIGDSKIVFLGEQDHGDAPTFLAKTRIIKYLHEKKGFDVLAFESDFFSLTYGWDLVPKTSSAIDSFIVKNIFGVWTACSACNQLFYKYIPESCQSGNPLILSGFDDQLSMDYSRRYLILKLDSILKRYNLPLTRQADYSTEILPLLAYLRNSINTALDSSILRKRAILLPEIKQQLGEKISPDDYWMIVMDNLIQENTQYEYRTDYWKRLNTRDEQMAHNLKWLAEYKYPGKKIIVWAANYHISKYNGHYPEDFVNQAKTMGAIFTTDSIWGANAYILGFTSFKGSAGRISQKKYDLPKPNANSFERWVNEQYSYAFINFRPYNDNNRTANDNFYMSGSIKGNALHTHHKAQWNKIFDGVFFIRTMYPCD